MKLSNLFLPAAAITVLTGAILVAGCNNSPVTGTSGAVEDMSASGSVAAALGGALAFSDSSGDYALNDRVRTPSRLTPIEQLIFSFKTANAAGTVCPTITSSTGCAASSTNYNLTYGATGSTCTFANGTAQYSGYQQAIATNVPAITAACGTFPTFVGTTGTPSTLSRQYTNSGFTASGVGKRTQTTTGTVLTIDDTNNNTPGTPSGTLSNVTFSPITAANTYGNFDSDVFPTTPITGCLGGCTQISFVSGARTQISFLHHLSAQGAFLQLDQTIFTGTLTNNTTPTLTPVAVTTDSGGNRTIASGTVTIFNNMAKVIGVSTITNLTFNNQCCNPVSGSIQTAFHNGNAPVNLISGYYTVAPETLTFTGCNTAVLTTTTGTSSQVNLSHCI